MNATEHHIRKHLKGLEDLCKNLTGNETFYSGIRPCGFHAGNNLVLSIYPKILIEQFIKNGKEPAFNYIITINDLEPSKYDFFNFKPEDTSIQKKHNSDRIINAINNSTADLLRNKIRTTFLKTSDMTDNSMFFKIADYLLNSKQEFINSYIKEEHTHKINSEEIEFTGLICDDCSKPVPTHMKEHKYFEGLCKNCNSYLSTEEKAHSFWMYYVPLIAMKLSILKPDVIFLGSDYIQEGQERENSVTKKDPLHSIMELYNIFSEKPLNFLLPPTILGSDGRKMSKEFNNIMQFDDKQVFKAAKTQYGGIIRP